MTSERSFRDRFAELLSTPSEERDEIFALLTNEERRAYMHQCYQVPIAEQIDPNHGIEPPFPDQQMSQLVYSAGENIRSWMIGRIIAGRPTMLVDIANPPSQSN